MKKVKEGYKMTEIGEIPSEWKVKKLGEITIGKGEYGIGASATEYIEGKPRYLRITDIGDSCRLLFNDIKGLDDADYEKYILKEGDIVFARTGNTTGKGYVYNREHGELVYAGFLIKYSIDNNIAKHNFIKYVIQSKRYWDWVNIMSTRSGQPGINSNEYSSFIVQLPPLKEQEKIASILSTVDEQIDNVDALIEKNKELKKGLMQTLLTKGIGHTKFKKTEIGEIPEEWEVSNLTNIVDIKGRVGWKGYTKKDLVEFGPLAIGAMHINSNNKLDLSEPVYLSKKKYEESPEIMVSKDDIILAQRGSLGKVVLIEKEIGEATINPSMVLIKNIKINSRYLYYFLCSEYIQKVIFKETSQTSIPMISQEQIGKFKIIIPTIKEQEKIASILSEVDKKIEEYENKKQKLEELKKGLMQQLLTGMIRVIV